MSPRVNARVTPTVQLSRREECLLSRRPPASFPGADATAPLTHPGWGVGCWGVGPDRWLMDSLGSRLLTVGEVSREPTRGATGATSEDDLAGHEEDEMAAAGDRRRRGRPETPPRVTISIQTIL